MKHRVSSWRHTLARLCSIALGLAIFTSYSAPAPPKSLRLYVLDCGTIAPMDPALFNLKPGEFKGDLHFVSPCYLIVHPKGRPDLGRGPGAGQGYPR